MRGLLILIIGIVFFGYAITRPADPPAPKASFAEFSPAAPKAVDQPKASHRPETARVARAPGPLDITPQAQLPPAANPAPAPSPRSSIAKQTTEVLTAAAIAALIIEASRKAYHATGRPCACPDDRMRNGRSCGRRSAYSRPGGASPLCYTNDVSEAMIKSYRARFAER
jgi:hypothetical protein